MAASDNPSFPLAERPWIPLRIRAQLTDAERDELDQLIPGTTPGVVARAGLRQAFTAAHLVDHLDTGDPAAETVLLRILVAIGARITGLDRDGHDPAGDDWGDRRWDALDAGRFTPAAIDAYLTQHAEGFDLFHPVRPWLQDPRLRNECTGSSGIAKLRMTRPAGSNQLWWPIDKPAAIADDPVPAPQAVLDMLAWRGHGPCGTLSNRSHAGGKPSKNAKTAPYRGLLSWHPAGRTLFETLVVGIPAPDTWPTAQDEDLAPWETPDLPNPLLPPAPCGPISLLTGRATHALLLQPSDDGTSATDCWVTWATQADLPDARDPYLIHREGAGPVRADASRAAWRDLDALLLKTRPGDTPTRRPSAMDSLTDLPVPVLERLSVRVYGIQQGPDEKGSATWAPVMAVTPPVLDHLERESAPEAGGVVADTRAHAEAIGRALTAALRSAWHDGLGESYDPRKGRKAADAWVGSARVRYWEAAEREFWRRINDAQIPAQFRRLALDAYDTVTADAIHTTRGLDAVEQHRITLTQRHRPAGYKMAKG